MKALRLYVLLVSIAALAVLPFVPWAELWDLPFESATTLVVLLLLGIVSERLTVATQLGQSGGTHSVVLIPLLASVLLFGPAAPVAFICVTGVFGEFYFREKGLLRGGFNIAQYIVSTAVAGVAFERLGGRGLAADGIGSQVEFALQLPQFIVFALLLMGLNQVLVSKVISLSQGVPFRSVWKRAIGKAGANVFYDLLVSPIAIVIAILGLQFGWKGLLIAVLPLFTIRHGYLTSFRLQQANRDLLEALVKAIETRDPYTSGHSRRVQMIATIITEQLHISERRKEAIEQAALLHDIGKIESIYTEILKKPAALSDLEREMIESHVTTGVELLRSLSSFPDEVIKSVLHHHEREDGKGYPSGLRGDAIPLGAKIIAIGDAIDAMLSDRPYRNALPVPVVREELRKYSGIQFDAKLVGVVTAGTLLEEHEQRVRAEKDAVDESVEPQPNSLQAPSRVEQSTDTARVTRRT